MDDRCLAEKIDRQVQCYGYRRQRLGNRSLSHDTYDRLATTYPLKQEPPRSLQHPQNLNPYNDGCPHLLRNE